MRISDWSSDVCSSDLVEDLLSDVLDGRSAENLDRSSAYAAAGQTDVDIQDTDYSASIRQAEPPAPPVAEPEIEEPTGDEESARSPGPASDRSAEHTSELQSLMRISYAGFCLKKKKHQIT